MQYRLRTLLTQFSLRDLFWLVLMASVLSYGYRDRRAMEARIAEMKTQTENESAKLMKATAARDSERLMYRKWSDEAKKEFAQLNEFINEEKEDRKQRQLNDAKLDPSFPVYYPPR
ncbi:MAG: hypothetical protein QM778_00510 [Myxococcales bacterium]